MHFAAALLLASPIFSYGVLDAPKSAVDCATAAAQLGERVHDLANVAIFRTACETDWGDAYALRVDYFAPSPLKVITTNDPAVYNQAWYTTAAECARKLPAQTELFRTATGLEPIVSFCTKTAGVGIGSGFQIRLEAFGDPVVAPRFFGQELSGYPVADPGAVARRIEANATAAGVLIFKSAIAPGIMEGFLSIGYYDRSYEPIHLQHNLIFPTAEECLQQTPAVEQIYTDANEDLLGSFCARGELVDATELNVVSLAKRGAVRVDSLGLPYASYSDCLADLPRAVDSYRHDHTSDVIRGVCTFETYSGAYGIAIYSRIRHS